MKYKAVMESCTNLKILYVEDNESAREATKSFLENFFKIIDIGVDGEDGLRQYNEFYKINNRYYDIVISDINMPKMNGIDMITNIKNIHKIQSFIVLSAYKDTENLIDLIRLEIKHFIVKPIQSEKLLEVLYKSCKSISKDINIKISKIELRATCKFPKLHII